MTDEDIYTQEVLAYREDKLREKLRDHFAGLAMQGDITNLSCCLNEYNDDEMLIKAEAAYRMADAMLKARKVKS